MKLTSLLNNTLKEAVDHDVYAHELHMLCLELYRKLSKPADQNTATLRMKVIKLTDSGILFTEEDVKVEKVIFCDDYHTAEYHNARNSTKDFLNPEKFNARYVQHAGSTHKKFGVVFVLSTGDEMNFGATIDDASEGDDIKFDANFFTGDVLRPPNGGATFGKNIDAAKGNIKKFDTNVKKKDYKNLCEEALKVYKTAIDARTKKIMELL